MAKTPTRVGPPTRLKSFKELGRENLRKQAEVAQERAKRTAPLRKGKRPARPAGKGIDRVGVIIKEHLNSETPSSWTSSRAIPRSYWERRFTFNAQGAETGYVDLTSAFRAMEDDDELDKLMAGRSVTIWVVVWDNAERREHLFTMAAFGDWDTALLDMASKLDDWSNRYSDEDDDNETDVKRLIVFVGRK